MRTRTEIAHTQQQTVSVNLIRANAVLQCSSAELELILEEEQRWNPAIETADGPDDPSSCDRCPLGGAPACAPCLYAEPTAPRLDADISDPVSAPSDPYASEPDERLDPQSVLPGVGIDPMLSASAPATLTEDLRWQIGAMGCPVAGEVIDYLLGSLDDRGYLRIELAEAAAVLQAPREEIAAAIAQLQRCEPAGIGARDVQECLRLQVEHWADTHDTPADPLALAIVRDHWELFAQRRCGQIARRLHVSQDDVERAVAFIRRELTPYPGAQYRDPWRHCPNNVSDAIRPDVIIRRGEHCFTVEVPGPGIRVSADCRRLAEAARKSAGGAGQTGGSDQHLVECVARADMLLAHVRRRNATVRRIALLIVERQPGFLETGEASFLRPMTRTDLALELGMHESTVSRALLHKYVQLPSQDVVPFECFFRGPSTTRDAIAEMIGSENAREPLSDQQIADALSARGLPTARRTVAKYRDEMRVPPSHLRRVR